MGRSHHTSALVLAAASCLLASMATWAQAPVPAPQVFPRLELTTTGEVRAVASQPDGGLVFGGRFTHVNGLARNNIARLRPDGTLDPAWNPSADGEIRALAVDASGAVFVGGRFANIGGQPRSRIAKLSGGGTGAADPDWDPSAQGASPSVDVLAVDAGGAVLVGGGFQGIGGSSRNNIAKLSGSGTGAADPVWNPSANAGVYALAVDANGAVYVGGSFTNLGGQPRSRIAKLSGGGAGAADAAWNPSATGGGGSVMTLAVDASGAVYAGGWFASMGGVSRERIAKLSGTGTGAVDPDWNPSANDVVWSLAVDASGAIHAGGNFWMIGGLNRSRIAKLSGSGTGAADPDWDPWADDQVYALAAGSGGELHIGGTFSNVSDQSRWGLATVESTAAVGAGIANTTGAGGLVRALARQPDGGLIVGGDFVRVNGLARENLLRLNADGTIDPSWNPSASDQVRALAVDASGRVYAGGEFTRIGGQSRRYIARMSGGGVGEVDPDWDPSANGTVMALAVDPGGSIYAGGWFDYIGGEVRGRIARLSASGVGLADPLWNPSADGGIEALALDASGGVYVGGWFSQVGGQPRSNLARLSGSDTGLADPDWNPSADNGISALALDAGGAVYAGGHFDHVGGQPRGRIVKLSGSGAGAPAPDWTPALTAGGSVHALAVDTTGAVYAGGWFTSIAGQSRHGIVKLSPDDAGTVDPDWNPSVSGGVYALAIDAGDAVHVGGEFSQVGAEPRAGLARILGDADPIFIGGSFE